MSKYLITPEGYNKIKNELKILKEEKRPNIINAISEARAFGDLSENTEYHAAKEKQRSIESKIKFLELQISNSKIMQKNIKADVISFGAMVTLKDIVNDKNAKYQIVGDYESDIMKKKISISSPLAKALVNKKVGDVVFVDLPNGLEKEYKILEVS